MRLTDSPQAADDPALALQVWVIYSTGDPCIGAKDTISACKHALRASKAYGQIRKSKGHYGDKVRA